MRTLASDQVRERQADRPRTLIARGDHVWMWPGIPLTLRRGPAIVAVPAETVHFWITRLHGPDALDAFILPGLNRAAEYLTQGDETSAQRALDWIGLNRLSQDGAALMHGVAKRLGLEVLDLGTLNHPSTWAPKDIAAQLPFFEQHFEAAGTLAKGGPWDESKHPRWPEGAPDSQGGEFRSADDDGPLIEGRSASRPRRPRTRRNSATIRFSDFDILPDEDTPEEKARRTIGGNGPPSEEPPKIPPLEEPPKIPQVEPPTDKLRNAFIKLAARWVLRAVLLGAAPEVLAFITALEVGTWLYLRCYPYIKAYLEPPRTLRQLQEGAKHPRQGFDVHHPVEKAQAERDGIPKKIFEGWKNKVEISTLRHWLITGWYMTKNKDYGGLSPRAYLKGKSLREKWRVGLKALIKFRVLKP